MFLVWDVILLIFFQNFGMSWANTDPSGMSIFFSLPSGNTSVLVAPHFLLLTFGGVCVCVHAHMQEGPQQSQSAVPTPQSSSGERLALFQRCQL